MKPHISGRAYVLGDNVDTDQIIPAQYLTYNPSIPEEYRMFGKYALAGVPVDQAGLPKGHVPFHNPDDEFIAPFKIIVAGKNFGCGSSREHAPIALAAAGIEAVVAEFYARMCPAGVYEVTQGTLRVNAPNCVDCKATDVLGPRWTPREGASGPKYKRM